MLARIKLINVLNVSTRIIRPLSVKLSENVVEINNNKFAADDYTNINPKILSYLDRKLHLSKNHPLAMVKQRIINYFYKTYTQVGNTPLFSVYDRLNPVVSVEQNFDSLLIPKSHISRAKSDCYYLNRNFLLRAHCTAHQLDLIRSGLDNFLIAGDVYRRDEIDSTHFPVFHQVDAVRIVNGEKLFGSNIDLEVFERNYNEIERKPMSDQCIDQVKQPCHTIEAVKLMEHELKTVLGGLVSTLFGEKVEYRWVDAYFPFTQPSWELEIFHKGKWMEILGCGIMKNQILLDGGVNNSIGIAFGLGLERLAMIIHDIPDIRLFWSKDSGFLNQFDDSKLDDNIKYKAVSQFPQCTNDLSFWLPAEIKIENFSSNDFYEIVREVGGDIVEHVSLIDQFTHPKSGKQSLCYRIVYRHMERTLRQNEVNAIHEDIAKMLVNKCNVVLR